MITRLLAAGLLALLPVVSFAQSAPPDFSVPTTKILAIGSFTPKATPDVLKTIIGPEVRATVRLYLTGKMDQWYVKADQSGVVFIMDCTTVDEARELLGKLPMGPAGVMEFQYIAMGPISPLRVLLAEPPR
jgi:hypothetical protein